jgi:hypothetical protein
VQRGVACPVQVRVSWRRDSELLTSDFRPCSVTLRVSKGIRFTEIDNRRQPPLDVAFGFQGRKRLLRQQTPCSRRSDNANRCSENPAEEKR